MIKIAPSILSADFSRLGEEIREAEVGGADWVHIDVMDGHFVPNITIGPPVLRCIRPLTTLPLDVHLMIENPDDYVDSFASAGADLITVHIEACVHLHRVIQQIHARGIRAGVALNPATPLGTLEEVLPDLELILVMSVNPGFGGQEFIEGSLDKMRRLQSWLGERGSSAEIQVDGGVNATTIGRIAAAGATILVAGSAIYGAKEGIGAAITTLRQAAERGLSAAVGTSQRQSKTGPRS